MATSSKRPLEYIERENTEVRRQSSVNPRAASLAATHMRNRKVTEVEEGMGLGFGRVSKNGSEGVEKKSEAFDVHKEKV